MYSKRVSIVKSFIHLIYNYRFRTINRCYCEHIVLVPTQAADVLLELDVVNILSLSDKIKIYIFLGVN